MMDDKHLQQLAKLRREVQDQSATHAAAQSQLKQQLTQQDESVMQLQEQVCQLEQECRSLTQSCATEQALSKSLLEQAAEGKAGAVGAIQHCMTYNIVSSSNSRSGTKEEQSQRHQGVPSSSVSSQQPPMQIESQGPASASKPPAAHSSPALPDSANLALTTLRLEADVLRRESGVLKADLATSEDACQKLAYLQQQDKRQHAAQLGNLHHTLAQLEAKHAAVAAMCKDTVAAMTHRIQLMLLQRNTGELESCAMLSYEVWMLQKAENFGEQHCGMRALQLP